MATKYATKSGKYLSSWISQYSEKYPLLSKSIFSGVFQACSTWSRFLFLSDVPARRVARIFKHNQTIDLDFDPIFIPYFLIDLATLTFWASIHSFWVTSIAALCFLTPLCFFGLPKAGMLGLTDIVSQISHGGDFSWRRLSSMVLFGLAWSGPSFHYWFGFLDQRFPGNGFRTVMTKMALDQTFSAPTGLAVYFSAISLMEGQDLDYIKAKFQNDYWKSLQANYVLWPAAHIINFRLIPSKYRIIYVNCVGFMWNLFLTNLKHRDVPSHAESIHQHGT